MSIRPLTNSDHSLVPTSSREYRIRIDTSFYAPRHRVLDKLARSIDREGSHDWAKRHVELVLGTDREIGGPHSPERRVGITPDNVAQLIQFFAELDVQLNVRVVQDAGALAGWHDSDYIRAGARVIRRQEITYHGAPPDVVHALKEPSLYEADFPGPFLRIGALHGGDFRPESGLAKLLARRDIALFDGSSTGSPGEFRIPIRGRMSIFAGEIAAEWVLNHMTDRNVRGRVVIVGGGKVGSACARKLSSAGMVEEIIVCEAASNPDRLSSVAAELSEAGPVTVIGIEGLDHPNLLAALKGAVAVVFAVAVRGGRAPRVVSASALRHKLLDQAIVIDPSIDERGAIQDDTANGDWSSEELIPWFEEHLLPLRYQAGTHMPSAYPLEASIAHGEVITPYLATLLYLSARHGGPLGALGRVREIPANVHGDDPLGVEDGKVLAALLLDLRNGLAVCPTKDGLELADTMPEADRAAIQALLDRAPLEYTGDGHTPLYKGSFGEPKVSV